MIYDFLPFDGPEILPALPAIMLLIVVWSLIWKGLALWHSSRRNQPYWFVALLLINTMGILDILYLFAVAKLRVEQLFEKQK